MDAIELTRKISGGCSEASVSQLGYWWDADNRVRLNQFYSASAKECTQPASQRPNLVVVNHALPDTVYLLDTLSKIGDVKQVFVKPRSINRKAYDAIAQKYNTAVADRTKLSDIEYVTDLFSRVSDNGSPIIALDIGGYFAKSLPAIQGKFGSQFWGVVEDTENGQQKYEKVSPLDSCVYSVARSPLKYAEDVLVGYSVVLATENIIRSFGDLHCAKRACVIGYGKIGKSSALALKAKGLGVSVYDKSCVKLVQASADGFDVHNDLAPSLQGADIIISCTGNGSIRGKDFLKIKNGAYLASATSSDDELDFNGTFDLYKKTKVGDHIEHYKSAENYFYLLNGGNAINFIYGPSAGTYISLVHSEIVACTELISKERPVGIHQASNPVREQIAKSWLQTFTP